ncbi:N-acetyltransferase eso1, partial [Linderina macrospora]
MSKASIDEAYLDVSAVVQERILDGFDRGTIEWAADEDVMFAAEMGAEDKLPVPMVRWATVSRKGKERDTEGAMDLPSTTEFGVLVGEAVSVSIGWSDLQLRYAAEFANSLRARVFTELGYRSSAGIAHNRMLAKMGSTLHKPNQQTVLRASQVSAFMHSLELSKIPSMGGKFGSVVESALDARNAGDVLVYSLDQLTLKLGKERAEHLYRVCQGVDDSEVVDRNEPQSLLTAKNFGRFPVRDMAHLERWLSMNGMDLWMRVVEEWEANKRWPRSLGVNYTTVGCKTRSKTVGFPLRHLQSAQTSPDAVVNAARACLVQIASAGHASSSGASSLMATNAQAGGPGLFPLAGFSLQAKGFQRDMASAS